jgi:hypothetical protein
MVQDWANRRMEVEIRIAAINKQIEGVRSTFEAFSMIGNKIAAEEQREKYHILVDQLLDASAEVWHITRADIFKTIKGAGND